MQVFFSVLVFSFCFSCSGGLLKCPLSRIVSIVHWNSQSVKEQGGKPVKRKKWWKVATRQNATCMPSMPSLLPILPKSPLSRHPRQNCKSLHVPLRQFKRTFPSNIILSRVSSFGLHCPTINSKPSQKSEYVIQNIDRRLGFLNKAQVNDAVRLEQYLYLYLYLYEVLDKDAAYFR